MNFLVILLLIVLGIILLLVEVTILPGITIAGIGSFVLQSQVKLEGIKNATIAAYNNGKRITPEEARKINNEPAVQPVKTK